MTPRVPALLLALVSLAAGTPTHALDTALYARLLERHSVAVDDVASTRVDYAALRSSPDWERLLESLRDFDPARLATREERLAFWINAYNVLAIDVVRRHHPVESIRDVGSLLRPVWKRPAGEIAGRPHTLDRIEHAILRPLDEPRIHGAIVCASLSCPPLRREPYRADALGEQLSDNVRRWLADPRKGARLDRAAGTLTLSPIFDWFVEDFGGDVLGFVARHLPAGDAAWIRERRESLRVRWFDYDWSLNDTARAPEPPRGARLHAAEPAAAGARPHARAGGGLPGGGRSVRAGPRRDDRPRRRARGQRPRERGAVAAPRTRGLS